MSTQSSVREVSPPVAALGRLAECLLLAFNHDGSRQRFALVTDYPNKAPGSDRAFAALIFDGVASFVRERGDLERFREFDESYQAAENAPPIVVQGVRFSERSGGGTFQCWFGPNFGGLGFEYARLNAFTRDAHVRRAGKSFMYSDLASGEDFDFLSPFGRTHVEALLARL